MDFDIKQIKAGMALAGLNETELAEAIGMERASINKVLTGKVAAPREDTRRRIIRTIEDRGVDFTAGGGVRPRSDYVREYTGLEGQRRFNEDRIHTAVNSSQDFLYCANVSQSEIAECLSAELSKDYSEKMQAIGHFKLRGIRPITDKAPAFSPHIEYRALPSADFPATKFYVYGGKVAILRFAPEFKAVVINDRTMSNDFRKEFERYWSLARPYRGDE